MSLFSRRAWDVALLGVLGVLAMLAVRQWREVDPVKPENAVSTEVDLLALIEPALDAAAGTWRKGTRSLVTSSVPFGRLQIPYLPPSEYDLRMKVTRLAGTDSLNIGLARGERQIVAILDGTQTGDMAGLDIIDKRGFMENTTTFRGKLLPLGEARQILCTVREKRLTVKVNGQSIIDWPANFDLASIYKEWKVPRGDTLFVGTYATEFRIDEMVLLPLTAGGGTIR